MTNKTKHTPGIGKLREYRDANFYQKRLTEGDRRHRKHAAEELRLGGASEAIAEYEALEQINAELLEALGAEKRLVELWELREKDARLELTGGTVVGSAAQSEANILWMEIEKIRAVIAKARGQS